MYATTANRCGRHRLGGTRHPWAVHNISNLSSCLWKCQPVHIGQTSNYNPDISDFANQHAQLIEIERDVNIEDMTMLLSTKSATELTHIGLALVNMQVVKRLSAVHNATLVTLMPSVTGGSLPNIILRTGDIVKIDEAANDCRFGVRELFAANT
ncbi:hypothetical protein GGI13_004463 [Coemansia sp. RSA 455]|nr:hypothetical protein GGI13_004463 [Coemansia sp. RSA 455]